MEQLKINDYYRWQIKQLEAQLEYEQKAKARYIRAYKELKKKFKEGRDATIR